MPIHQTSATEPSARQTASRPIEKQPFKEDELQCLQLHLEAWSTAARQDKRAIFLAIYREGKVLGPKLDAKQWKKRQHVSDCHAILVLWLIKFTRCTGLGCTTT
jgi:hypothetical protein